MDNPLALDKIKADLGGKPIWVWGLLGGVAVLAGYYVFKSNKNAKVAGSIATGLGSVTDTIGSAFPTISQPEVPGVQANTGNTLGNENIETVESWKARGVIIGTRNGHTAINSNNALTKYLDGKPLTQKEANVVNEVILAIGTPPGGQNRVVQIIKDSEPKTNTSVNDTGNKPKKSNPIIWKPKPVVPQPATPGKPVPPNALAQDPQERLRQIRNQERATPTPTPKNTPPRNVPRNI